MTVLLQTEADQLIYSLIAIGLILAWGGFVARDKMIPRFPQSLRERCKFLAMLVEMLGGAMFLLGIAAFLVFKVLLNG
ncbi:MAG: hypothetical protein AB1626_01740 [Candidatus Micrarchaeota archaeon]